MANVQNLLSPVHVRQVQRGQLAHAKTGCVEQLKDGAVPSEGQEWVFATRRGGCRPFAPA